MLTFETDNSDHELETNLMQQKTMSQHRLTCKPGDYKHMIEITQ